MSRLFCFLIAINLVVLADFLSAQIAHAQDAAPSSAGQQLYVEAPLVIVDVTVQDKDGHPVHGLKREDFTLTEDKQAQPVRSFESFSNQNAPQAGSELPKMPPGTFTDYTPVPAAGALNILLLDSLNTAMSDQSYVRNQLQQYVKKAKPGTRIAIFGLSRRLFLLQGFSSDPQVLKDVVEHKLTPRTSDLLNDAVGTGTTTNAASDVAATAQPSGSALGSAQAASIVSNMQQFEADQKAFQQQLRIQYTLDAFNLLAHYLSNFPGRKNLIWFSGSFPINVLPNPNLQNGFAAMENNNPEFRETINMFSRAQVAVYPVDARGLISDPSFSAATGKRNPIQSSPATFSQTQDSDHMMMSALATETGGKAFYDKNNLESAVQDAVDSGANYYSLSYSPANQSWNGNYRNIHVTLNGKLQAAGYQLAYRQGYYADGPGKVTQTNAEVTAPTVGGTAVGNTLSYIRAAMSHGAPTPQDILFKVRIQPVSKAPEQMLAPNNMTDPVHPIKLPFVRYAIDIAAVGDDFQLPVDKDGHYTGVIEFSAFLYDNDGILLNSADKALQVNLTPEAYKQFLNGVNAHLELSVPVKDGGADFLRVGVRSASSNRIGVVEVPIDAVSAR